MPFFIWVLPHAVNKNDTLSFMHCNDDNIEELVDLKISDIKLLMKNKNEIGTEMFVTFVFEGVSNNKSLYCNINNIYRKNLFNK